MSSLNEALTPSGASEKLQRLLAEVEEALAPHDSIKADDSQYEDPAEMWLRPLKRQLQEALEALELNQ